MDAIGGAWRCSDVEIVEIDFTEAGPDGQRRGPAARTYDIEPHAGGADFDNGDWPVLDPATLDQRRGAGRVSFNWYRIGGTVPAHIGDVDPAGSTLVFETTVDDYAEIWVNGELPRRFPQAGSTVVAGWNVPNRVLAARDVRPRG